MAGIRSVFTVGIPLEVPLSFTVCEWKTLVDELGVNFVDYSIFSTCTRLTGSISTKDAE